MAFLHSGFNGMKNMRKAINTAGAVSVTYLNAEHNQIYPVHVQNKYKSWLTIFNILTIIGTYQSSNNTCANRYIYCDYVVIKNTLLSE